MTQKRYLAVGIFVLSGILLMVALSLWFTNAKTQDYAIYRIVFHEPIDGVSVDSIVRYSGVEVGRVKAIELDQNELGSSNIIVDIGINKAVRISTATFASMKAQGITGMSFINLQLDRDISPQLIEARLYPPYPIILSRPSLLQNLTDQAQGVTVNIKEISNSVKNILNNQNSQHINNTIANLDQLSSALLKQSSNLNAILSTTLRAIEHVEHASNNITTITTQLLPLIKSLESNSIAMQDVIYDIHHNTLNNINAILLPNINQSMLNISKTSLQLTELIHRLNQNPAILVRGTLPLTHGPAE